MECSDLILVVTTLFLGAIALVVPVLTEFLTRRVFAPKLVVRFREEPPYCLRTLWRSQLDPSLCEPVYYFRFEAKNEGKSQAKLCEAVIEELWVYGPSAKPSKLPNFSSANLHWAGSPTRFIDINPRRRVYCDIGHVSSLAHQRREEKSSYIDAPGKQGDALRFLLDQLEYPYSQPNCFLPGRYAIKVALYSENAAPQDLYFDISWSGVWQDTDAGMFRELVITRVPSAPQGGA